MGNERGWSRDVIPVGRLRSIPDRSRTRKQAVNESSAPRPVLSDAQVGGPWAWVQRGSPPWPAPPLAQGARPARPVPGS
jgi:hypothetical protein